ncbi:hypothetical protein [Spiroplasma tabanidicola]|uniref:Uncharacterized protein n=1 Tax=Spiroplasma tabanidicola TaxID=324079 RepID=A0A6I6C5I9_9MOLU|nr:hypothetical protein [Spiroplasma tabanidicola]QGS51400.1 hypothetical protein STABA_v1c00330 [Spiroplasma tabanidicola]
MTENTERIMQKVHRNSRYNLFELSEELTPFYEAVNEISHVYDKNKCSNFFVFYYVRLRQRLLDYTRWITRKNRDLFKTERVIQYEDGTTSYEIMIERYSYENYQVENLKKISDSTFIAFCKTYPNYIVILATSLYLKGYAIKKICMMLGITRRDYDKIIKNFKNFLINLLIEDKTI